MESKHRGNKLRKSTWLTGETCDDGNNINDSGSCSSDCKRINYFDIGISPIIRCDNIWNYNEADVNNNEVNANQACREKGFTKAARFVYTQLSGRTVRCNWNGTNWEYYPYAGYGYITDLWCE